MWLRTQETTFLVLEFHNFPRERCSQSPLVKLTYSLDLRETPEPDAGNAGVYSGS